VYNVQLFIAIVGGIVIAFSSLLWFSVGLW